MMTETVSRYRKRNSSIELLKIFAIVLIVTSHVVQTLGTKGNRYISYSDYYVDLSETTSNIQFFLLSVLQYSGNLGNTIFFVCSAWFLLDDTRTNKKKILMMLADIWVISVICLVAVSILTRRVRGSLVLQSLLPTTYGNNWYLTCYILFFLLHPFLNMLIAQMSQKQLFRTAFLALLLYFVLPFPLLLTKYLFDARARFFSNELVVWIAIYFCMAYMKKYMPKLASDLTPNILLTTCGIVGHLGIIVLTNIFGQKNSAYSHMLLIWNENCNPFILIMVVGVFNLVRKAQFTNTVINYISSLSLYIYVIHENILLRWLYRPAMWHYVYSNFGYDHILVWVFFFVLIIFFFGLGSSIVYHLSIHRLVERMSSSLYPVISKYWKRFESNSISARIPRDE